MAELKKDPAGSIIDIKNVSKWFGDKQVLRHVNLKVKKGEFVTILGPSGCGKTTLLRILAGFHSASEGEILVGGEDITKTPPHKRPMNTVFQRYALFPHLNVFDNIAFGLKLKKLKANESNAKSLTQEEIERYFKGLDKKQIKKYIIDIAKNTRRV